MQSVAAVPLHSKQDLSQFGSQVPTYPEVPGFSIVPGGQVGTLVPLSWFSGQFVEYISVI